MILVATLCALASAAQNQSPAKKNTLVLIDNAAFYTSHSQFFRLLSDLGHTVAVEQVSVRSITDGHIKLEVDKEFLYDNIIFMASSLAELPETTNFNLARFFEKGGNIFFIIDNDVSPFFREYFKKFGFGIDKSGSYLVDYEKALDSSKPQIFNIDNFRDISMLVENVEGPVVYSGLGLETTIFENSQISVLARGNMNTASVVYTTNGKRLTSHMSKNNMLILGIQVAAADSRDSRTEESSSVALSRCSATSSSLSARAATRPTPRICSSGSVSREDPSAESATATPASTRKARTPSAQRRADSDSALTWSTGTGTPRAGCHTLTTKSLLSLP